MKVILGLLVAASATQGVNPVTRVVKLLEKLHSEIETDGKAEEVQYTKFKCWCEQVVKGKEASIADADVKIRSLATYIDDVNNGRIELTDERKTLEAAKNQLKSELETLIENRDAEKAEFAKSRDQLQATIDALDEATATLQDAIDGHETGELVAVDAALGRVLLTKVDEEDATFLRKSVEVPEKDWEKLNKRATFKGKYKARSQKIQKTLNDMLQKFETNLTDLKKQEKNNSESYDDLKKAKDDMLQSNSDALNKMEKETGARGKSVAESQEELDELKDNNTADRGFIKDTKTDCKARQDNHVKRTKQRSSELAAITKAIGILRDDDARDVMRRSFASHGDATSFLQVRASPKAVLLKTVAAIRQTAKSTVSMRLQGLAARVAMMANAPMFFKDQYKEVITKIDEMLADLAKEYASDLEKKEDCEDEAVRVAKVAKEESIKIDDNHGTIDAANDDIARLEDDIEARNQEITELQTQLEQATENRKEENEAWKKTHADDVEAERVVQHAYNVLKDEWAARQNEEPVLLQNIPLVAGEAPPPPPKQPDGSYMGKQGDGQGILQMMSIIMEDVQHDRDSAEQAEKEAENEFNNFKKENTENQNRLTKENENAQKEIGGHQSTILDSKAVVSGAQKTVNTNVDNWKKLMPHCIFFTNNFPLRKKNREAEISGLQKAKAILNGATFDAPDPNREMRPNDA